MPIQELGCCGAYCGTCKVKITGACQGCKLGYDKGERDINKAKCKMKVCCIKKTINSCADCGEYAVCPILDEFYGKNGYKYGKYKQALEYINAHGYDEFLKIADTWTNAYGKYK